MKIDALKEIRKHAVYFIAGEWPAIVQAEFPRLNIKKRYAAIIIELDD